MEKLQVTVEQLGAQWSDLAKQFIMKYDNNISAIQQVKATNGVAELIRFATHIRECQEMFFEERKKVYQNAETEGFVNYKVRLKLEIDLMLESMELIDIIQMNGESSVSYFKLGKNTQEIIIIGVLIIACAVTFAFS